MAAESTPSTPDIPQELKGGHIPLEQAMESLWPGKKAIIACGHAFVGEQGYQVKVANILKLSDDEQSMVGWAYQHRLGPYGQYEHEGFHRIDGSVSHAKLPDTFFVWISEIDESVVLQENEQRAREIMDWALSLDNSERPNLLP